MNFAIAVAQVAATIDAVPNNGLANGTAYANTAVPSSSHVRSHLKWPINDDGTARSLVDHVCRYTAADKDTAARATTAEKAEIEVGVIVAVARLSATRYYGWTRAHLNVPECTTLAASTTELTVHANHEDEVAAALEKWAAAAPRYMALFYYNSISFELFSHHHKPSLTKSLATTTIVLTGLKEWIAGNAEREGSIFHDTFHPLSSVEKSNAARRTEAREHLSDLKFDNLRKRIAVKAPDSGVAINYLVLYRKARAYRHRAEDVPTTLAPPASLSAAIAAYENAATSATLATAVSRLRAFSTELAEPSAYLAGFILGREAHALGDADLDLRTAKRTTTILGCPAYARAAGEYSGSFAAGKEAGYKTVPADVPDQVIPRCAASVAAAAKL